MFSVSSFIPSVGIPDKSIWCKLSTRLQHQKGLGQLLSDLDKFFLDYLYFFILFFPHLGFFFGRTLQGPSGGITLF